MSTGLKANSDGSAAIQVGGTDVITLTSGGAATFVTSPTTVQAGTAAAPSITFSGDTNTGIYSPAADQVAIATGGTQRLTVNSSGNTQTVGTISVGNATPSTSGAGITFPATQSASTDANTLDDYEEGTWTPQIFYQNATDQSTATNTTQYGFYTKIGNQVTLTFQLTFSQSTATGSLANDNIGVKNFPFTGASGTGSSRVGSAMVSSMVTPTNCALYMSSSITYCLLISLTDVANLSNEVGTGSHTIYGTITYFTA